MIDIDLNNKTVVYQMIAGLIAVGFILIGCLLILAPFFPAILVATILALSTWPAFMWLNHRLHHRTALSALLMTILLAVCFIAPIIVIGTSTAENFSKVYVTVQKSINANPAETSAFFDAIPYAGHTLEKYWLMLISDEDRLNDMMQEYAGTMSQFLLRIGGTIGRGVLDLTMGVVIAYFFFRHGTRAAVRISNLIDTFGGDRGQHLLEVSKNTLIGVVYGILGTALAQGALAAIGFWIANVPGASFLGLITFFLSFIPMGPPVIWIPAAVWLFSQGHGYMGIFLVIWGVVVISTVDNVLKPYFISRGANMPFLLVLMGVIGGIMAFGFIGVFIGPTLLALAYSLILGWSTTRKDSFEAAAAKD